VGWSHLTRYKLSRWAFVKYSTEPPVHRYNEENDQLYCKQPLTKTVYHREKVKVKVTLEQATKAQRGSRCIGQLFLQSRR